MTPATGCGPLPQWSPAAPPEPPWWCFGRDADSSNSPPSLQGFRDVAEHALKDLERETRKLLGDG